MSAQVNCGAALENAGSTRLAAAAPELLAAVNTALDYLSEDKSPMALYVRGTLALAIANATGVEL